MRHSRETQRKVYAEAGRSRKGGACRSANGRALRLYARPNSAMVTKLDLRA
jgi:hypothetical protein